MASLPTLLLENRFKYVGEKNLFPAIIELRIRIYGRFITLFIEIAVDVHSKANLLRSLMRILKRNGYSRHLPTVSVENIHYIRLAFRFIFISS